MNVTGSTALNGTSGATAVNISAGTLTLGSSDRLANGGTVAVSGSGILSMGSYNDTVSGVQMTGGSITGSGGTLTSTSAFDMQAGSVSAKLGGSVALNKTTSGTVTLTGANAYTGATAVSSGILNIQNDSALGDTASGTSVTSGAALQLQGGRNIGAEALTIRGMGVAGSGGALRSISGNNTYGGLVTLGDISRINSDADTLSLTGGVDNAGYNLYIGGAGNTILSSITGSGILTHDGAGALTVTSITTNALDVTGGSINVSSPSTVGTFTMSGGSVTGAGTITGTSYSLTDSGSISASLGDKVGGGSILTKTGSGTVTISGTNTYTGNTTISEGKLALSGTGSIALSPLINIASGASLDTTGLSGVFTLSSGQTLKGTGTVTGNINMGSGSTIAPGNSPGHQHITESTTWLTGASYDWEINSLTGTMGEDPGWDWIDIGGTLTIQDDYEFHISLLNGVMPVAGASFIAASAGVSISLIGTPIFKDESTGQVITTWSAHVVGNDLKLQYDGSGVPEPATVVGLLIAGLGMIARRRLLRRQQ
jgi:autotransporter-associated beta strand protein